MPNEKVSDIASKGGLARAKALSPRQRSEIARAAVEARWAKMGKAPVPRATHTGILNFGGDTQLPCAVLEDGTRVISQRGFTKGMGGGKPTSMTRRGAGKLPAILSAQNLKAFIDEDLEETANPVEYISPEGQRAMGIRAEAIPEFCKVWLRARSAGVLRHNQEHFATKADVIIQGMATVGIVALIDEATGYQDQRPRDALAKILEAFVAKELRRWVKTFKADFYKEMFRLKSVPFDGTVKSPRYFGHLTNDLVYARLAPGVLAELRRVNPVGDKGRRKHKHFQWLTADIGHPKLEQHLHAVTVLMKANETWESFYVMLEKALPKYTPLPLWETMKALPE